MKTTELGVLVRAHHLLIGIPARYVARLVLPGELEEVRAGAPGLVLADGERWPAWDLGALLGLPLLSSAWVLARVPRGAAGTINLALRTGPCIVVEGLPSATALPAGALSARRDAFGGAFAVGKRDGKRRAPTESGPTFGLLLDLPRLLTEREASASVALQRAETAA